MSQVIFEILKLSPDHFTNKPPEWQAANWPLQAQNGKPNDSNEIFFKPDLNWLAKVLGQQDKMVREYYSAASYAPQFPVTFSKYLRRFNQLT